MDINLEKVLTVKLNKANKTMFLNVTRAYPELHEGDQVILTKVRIEATKQE